MLISKVAIQRCSCETNVSANLVEHLGNTCKKSFLSKAAGCNSRTSTITNSFRAKHYKARGLNHELSHLIFLELREIRFQGTAIDNFGKCSIF